ncbi:MAG: inositol monophosphatase family protein [Paracoccaceae bacterium]
MDTDWLLATCRDAARAHVLPRFRALGTGEVTAKARADDLVTVADVDCEAAITAAIRARYPNALVVGEEAASADPGLVDRIGAAETCVILDPVDGTWNFAHGLACFGLIVCVTRHGVPVWGALCDPLLDDAVVADAAGARLRGARLSTGAAGPALTGFAPVWMLPDAVRGRAAQVLASYGAVTSLRCSCHEYRQMAQGAVDFVLSVSLNPWDHAAGALAVRAAGGVARTLGGVEYDATVRDGPLLAARDEAVWARVTEDLRFLA